MPALRFLVEREGGDSSGVNGALELPEGLGSLLSERVDTFEEPRLPPLFVSAWCTDSDP